MKKILVFGINKKVHSVLRVVEELEKANIPYTFAKWNLLSFFEGKLLINGERLELKEYSSAFFNVPNYYLISKKKKDRPLAFDLDNEFMIVLKEIERHNILAMNRSFFINTPFYNKFTQSSIFAQKNIPSIPTLHLSDNGYNKVITAIESISLTFPIVAKESDGGLGDQVWKLENKKELKKFLRSRRNLNLIYQPFLKNKGDYRVLIIGGKSIGIMKRSAQGKEWKNNFALGGNISAYTDPKMEIFAENACEKMGLDYAGVDIFKIHGNYLIIEINAFAKFEGFEKVYTKKNVGALIVKYLTLKK